ncbi:hypothetical protein ACJX0J_015478, partial [Zea mays]
MLRAHEYFKFVCLHITLAGPHVANAFQIDEVIWKLKLELRVEILMPNFIDNLDIFLQRNFSPSMHLRRDAVETAIYAHELLYAGVVNLQMIFTTSPSLSFGITMNRCMEKVSKISFGNDVLIVSNNEGAHHNNGIPSALVAHEGTLVSGGSDGVGACATYCQYRIDNCQSGLLRDS